MVWPNGRTPFQAALFSIEIKCCFTTSSIACRAFLLGDGCIIPPKMLIHTEKRKRIFNKNFKYLNFVYFRFILKMTPMSVSMTPMSQLQNNYTQGRHNGENRCKSASSGNLPLLFNLLEENHAAPHRYFPMTATGRSKNGCCPFSSQPRRPCGKPKRPAARFPLYFAEP